MATRKDNDNKVIGGKKTNVAKKSKDNNKTETKRRKEPNVNVGDISDISGNVNIATGNINQTFKTIQQRALTAAEAFKRNRDVDNERLAEGVREVIQNLSNQVSQGTESDSPYKGLLSYSLREAAIFYGRTEAKRNLLNCIKQSSLTVLHAESGAGKSSLLQAGIAAQLIANGHLALYLRPHKDDPVDFIKRMFVPDLMQAPDLAGTSLREFLRRVCAVLGPKVNLYLLLDQFEEFFHFLKKEERQFFLESLADCVNDPTLKVRWILALRAEGLSDLAELESFGITPFKNAYRLNRLNSDEAKEVIIEPAKRNGIKFEESLINHILDTLTTNGEIIPTQLQLVCSALTDDLGDVKTITLGYYINHEGDTEGILRDYLKSRVDDLPADERVLAWKVLRALITSDLHRTQKTTVEIIDEIKVSVEEKEQISKILGKLIERRLLVVQSSTIETFELAHDSLVKDIQLDPEEQARKAAQELLDQDTRSYQRHRTLISKEHLAVIQPYEKELNFSPDAKELFSQSKKAVGRRRNISFGISVAVAITMSLLAVWGWGQTGQAIINAHTAEAASTLAFNNAEIAKANEMTAQAASTEAYNNLQTAQAEKANADNQKTIADNNAQIALARQMGSQAQFISAASNSKQMIADLLAIQSLKLVPFSDAAQVLVNNNTEAPLAARMSPENAIVWSTAISPDGKYVATGDRNNTVSIWGATTDKPIAQMSHSDWVSWVVFSPNGEYMASASKDTKACLWKWTKPEEPNCQELGDEVYRVIFSPDGKYIAAGARGNVIKVWAVDGQSVVKTLDKSGYYLAFSPNSKHIVSGSTDGKVRIWDIETSNEISTKQSMNAYDKRAIVAVAYSPNGEYIAAGGWDNTVHIWNAATGEPIAQMIHNGFIAALAFSPEDSNYMVTASGDPNDGTARVWETTTGREIARMTHDLGVNSVAFSPDGMYVVSGSSDGTARVWEAFTGKEVARMTFDSVVFTVAFSKDDGRYVVAGSQDGTARVWDASKNNNIIYQFPDELETISPNSKYAVSWNCAEVLRENECTVWTIRIQDNNTNTEVSHITVESNVNRVAFSPDNKYIIAGIGDKTARIWEVDTAKEVVRKIHDDAVTSVAFSPDGKYAISQSDGSPPEQWLWRPADLISTACAVMPRNLTLAEWQQYVGTDVPYEVVCDPKTYPNAIIP